jgi:hypothetical protein
MGDCAENPDLLVPSKTIRIECQRRSQVGHRTNGNQGEFTGTFLGESDHLGDGTLVSGGADRQGKARITEPIMTMNVPTVGGARHWTLIANSDWNASTIKGFQHPKCVDCTLRGRAIAVGTANCDDFHAWFSNQMDQHQCVVNSDVRIENQAMHAYSK